MKQIGNKLRKAREEKKISLEKVYRETKIHPDIILALEEEKLESLPSPVYVKGFITKYAKYLGLDPNPLVEKYSPKISKKPGKFLSVKDLQTKTDYIKTLIYVKKSFYIIIAIGIILITIWGVNRIFHKSKIMPTAPSESDSLVKQTVEKELLVPENRALRLRIQTIKDSWIQVKSDGSTVFQKVLHKGSSQEFKADNQFQLWVGKASGVKLYLNDIPLNSLGSGVVKNVLIDRTGISFPSD